MGKDLNELQKVSKIRLLEDRILIRRTPNPYHGSIEIPDKARQQTREAIIIKIGPGLKLDNGQRGEMPVSPGDRVVCGKYSGFPSDSVMKGSTIIRETEIMAIIDDNETKIGLN